MYSASNISNAQREYIGNVIAMLTQREADFVSRLERTGEDTPTNYRGRREPFESVGNPSLSFGNPAGGDLATPGSPTLNHWTIPYVWMNLGLDIDYESLLNKAAGTVNDPLKRAVESTSKQMVKWLNIYASNGDGTTKLATASAAYDATNATTIKTFVTNGSTDTIGATQVIPGQKGYIYDPTGTTQRVGTVGAGILTVSTAQVSKTSLLFTSNLPSDYVSGDIFVPEGATPSVGYHGIPALIANTGTIYGVSRSSVPTTQSTIVAAGGGLSNALLFQTYSQVKQRVGKKMIGMLEMFTNITQYGAYYSLTTATAQLLFPHQRNERPQIDIGGDNPDEFTWFGAKMNCMLDWIGSRIDFLTLSEIKIANLKDGGEMLPPFDKPLPKIGTTANAYAAAQQEWWDVAREYFTTSPQKHGALTGLSIAGYAQQKS